MQWDIERYEQLQDSAWELELLANEQETHTDRDAGGTSEMSRTSARGLRRQAAHLLAQYWAPRPPERR